VHLLSKVTGLTLARAGAIVKYRLSKGKIKNRSEIQKLKGIGAKSFKQCSGFLRIYDGSEKLDSTWIHPESYPLAKSILKKLGFSSKDIGSTELRQASEKNFEDVVEKLGVKDKDNLEFVRSAIEQREEDVRKGSGQK
jgi:uncharacterized protein